MLETIISILVIGAAGFYYVFDGKKENISFLNKNKTKKSTNDKVNTKTNTIKTNKSKDNYKQSKDIFPFEKIKTNGDKALIKLKNNTYVGGIEVHGVNYNLLSIDEKLLIEEVFQSVINGISYPIQIITQSRKMDIDNYNNIYRKRLEGLGELLKAEESKYTILTQSDKTNELKDVENNIKRLKTQIAYGEKLVIFINNIAYNADILDRKFYILTEYEYDISLFNEKQTEDEMFTTAFNTINNRLESIIGGLKKGNMDADFLDGYRMAALLYISYNKETSTYYKLSNAMKNIFSNFIVTSKPVEYKIYENEERKLLETADFSRRD
ncbi:MAG: hypothetical protein M0Q88_02705 [Bacilli bacterium]|nr:hypothetical protein [Bacilli bacterium]